ncbi:MAG: carboxypeptidase regulatory-like domain-containing protein [Planctomycetes bacterium]|nr:carboxypeptidase regulatory-like domain-containing protein [Planctomycetota bacterium]
MVQRAFFQAVTPIGMILAAAAAALGAAPQGMATIRGKAISTAGQPVAGVRITLASQLPDAPKEVWTATTAAAGTFSLEVPGNRSLGLSVEAPPDGKLAPCAVRAPSPLMVSPGQVREVTVFLAPATAKLAGTVAGADKRPVAGAAVNVSPSQYGWLCSRSATTDRAGRYEISGLAPGSYTVRSVDPPAGTPFIRLFTWKPGGVRTANIGDREMATEDFVFPLGARLAGRVLDEAGKPLAGAQVSCRLDAATEVGKPSVYQLLGQAYSADATSDAAGTYSLGGLTQETYCVEVRSPEGKDLAPSVLRGVNAPLEGDVKLQDVVLYRGATLIGSVVGPDGKPIAGAEVAYTLPLGWRGTRVAAKTDAAGKVEFRGLASGAYSLTVQPPDGSPACKKQFDNVAVLSGLALQQPLKLPEGARVTGSVTDPHGKPVPGATVMASYGYYSRATATTDAAGRYTIVGLAPPDKLAPAQPYGPKNQVTAVPPAEAKTLASNSVDLGLIPAGGTAAHDIALRPGVAIAGQVTGPDGKPVAGAQVGVYRYTRGAILGFGSVFTDAQGRYALGHLTETALSVTVDPPEGSPLLREVPGERTFEPGKTSTVDVKLDVGAAVVGQVVTSAGEPVVGAQVSIQASTGQYPRPGRVAMSGVGGAFRAEGLPPGPYDIQCTPPDHRLRARPASLTIEGKREHKANVILARVGFVAGTVCDAKGNLLGQGDVWVSLRSTGAAPQQQDSGTAHPDAAGRYKLGGLAPDAYTLRVTIGREGQKKRLTPPAPARIEVEEGKETRHDITVPLGPEGKATHF